MHTEMEWSPWAPPYDPRQIDSTTVAEDAHGRLVEMADCGLRCPGCGVCCAGYRDAITGDYWGVEEFEGNLKLGRGGLVELDGGGWYRISQCGESCPGYGQCCPPFDMRRRPETVADARRVLLERDDGWRWEVQEALLILAHNGSAEAVETLEAYLSQAHTRLEGFAECALDEGRYFASVPRNAEEAHAMLKREVLQTWEERATAAQIRIDEEIAPEIERQRYELEITRRLLEQAQYAAAQEIWQAQVDVLEMTVGMAENDLAEEQQELALCEAMIAAIEADLAVGQPG